MASTCAKSALPRFIVPGAAAIMSLFGLCSNAIFLIAIWRDAQLRKIFDRSVRRILSAQAIADLLFALVGAPLWSMARLWPRANVWSLPGVCQLVDLFMWYTCTTAQYYLATLALTRLFAVAWPHYYRERLATSGWWTVASLMIAPLLGCSVTTSAHLLGSIELNLQCGWLFCCCAEQGCRY